LSVHANTPVSDQPFAQQIKRDAGSYSKCFVARAVTKRKTNKESRWEQESGSCLIEVLE